MKTSKILISTFVAAAAMNLPAHADFTWNGGESITAAAWATESNWTLPEGTSWTANGPGTAGSNMWDAISVSNASGSISNMEGWTLNLTLASSNLTIDGLKKLQGGCSLNIDASSTLTVNNFGYADGNDGATTTVNNSGVFNLQLAKDQGGEGFVMNLGSTGIFNVTSLGSGAHTVKVASVSAELTKAPDTNSNGAYSSAADSSNANKTIITRKLITLGEGASFDSTATTFSATSGVDGIYSFSAADSLENAVVGTYAVTKDSSGYTVSYVVYTGELLAWAGTEGNSEWNTTSTNWGDSSTFTDGGNVVFGAGESLSKTVSVNSDISATYVSVQDDYTFSIAEGAKLSVESMQVADGKSLTLSGAGTFAVSSNGFVSLANGAVASFTGTLEIGEGATLSLSTASNGVAVNAMGAGTLNVTLTDTWANAISVSAPSSESFTGTVNVVSGYFTINSVSVPGVLSIADGVNFQANGSQTFEYTGDLNIVGTNHQMHANSGSSLTFSGNVSGGGYASYGSGHVYFTGTVDLDSFTTGAAASVDFSGTTSIDSMTLSHAGTYTFSGTAEKTIGTLTQSAGTVNVAGTATISTLTLSGGTFNVLGGGVLTLSGHDALGWSDGGSFDSTGKIVLQGSSADSIAKLVIADTDNGAGASMTLSKEIQLRGYTEVSNASGSTFNTFGGKITATGTDNLISSSIELRKAFTVEVTNAADELTISGVLSKHRDGNNGFTKTGEGTLTLSGANTFDCSVTVSAGTLIAANDSALGTGTVTISGGQLSVAQDVTLNNTAITIVLGSAYESLAAIIGEGSLADGVTITLTKAEETALALASDAVAQETYRIFAADSLMATSVDENSFTLGEGWDGWEILSYDSSSGTLTLSMIPEPSAFGLLAGAGALALVAARRRRNKR